MREIPQKILDRKDLFLTLFDKKESGCWEWNGVKNKFGYGLFFKFYAHRVSFLFFKEKPKNLCVCHICDNRICVNPDHLFLGSVQDNVTDMIIKFRNSSKISERDVVEIRKLRLNKITGKEIADKYGITVGHVYDIFRRRSWKNVESNHEKIKEDKGKKIRVEDAIEIRRLYSEGVHVEIIGEKFNINKRHVFRIVSGERWSWLETPYDKFNQ